MFPAEKKEYLICLPAEVITKNFPEFLKSSFYIALMMTMPSVPPGE